MLPSYARYDIMQLCDCYALCVTNKGSDRGNGHCQKNKGPAFMRVLSFLGSFSF